MKVIKEIERGIANPTVATLNQIGDIFGLEVAFVRRDRLRSASPSLHSTSHYQRPEKPTGES